MITTPNTVPPFTTDGSRLDRIAADETFDGPWPFEPHFYTGIGFEQHYVDEGEGDPIVLLHGEPTWGYLYRNFIPALSRTHRVFVPDHTGFGKSATPQDKEYCLRTHTLNLVGLLDSLQLDRPITLFVQDWGVPIGLHYALRFSARVARIMVGSVIPMPPILAQKIERMGGHQPAEDGRMPIEDIVAGRPELRGSPTGTPSVPITSWFPWILTGLPDDPDYVCPALHSSRPAARCKCRGPGPPPLPVRHRARSRRQYPRPGGYPARRHRADGRGDPSRRPHRNQPTLAPARGRRGPPRARGCSNHRLDSSTAIRLIHNPFGMASSSYRLLDPTTRVAPALHTVSNWANTQDYEPTAVATFLEVTGFRLVAHALAYG